MATPTPPHPAFTYHASSTGHNSACLPHRSVVLTARSHAQDCRSTQQALSEDQLLLVNRVTATPMAPK